MICEVDGLYKISGRALLAVLSEKPHGESLRAAVARTLHRPEDVVRLVGADLKKVASRCVEKTAGGSCTTAAVGQWVPCPRCWALIMRSVFKERGRFCAVCGKTKDLTGHHIRPRAEGGDHVWTNIVPLCPECHDFVELHDQRPRTLEDVIRCGLERLA